jgi:hypothetical protein
MHMLSLLRHRSRDWYYEIRNRCFVKYYRIDIRSMPKGAWWDFDRRSFHVMFQLFEDYILNEEGASAFSLWKSHPTVDDYNRDAVKYYESLTFVQRLLNKKEIHKRFALAHINWEIGLSGKSFDYEEEKFLSDSQSEIAKKKLELFNWWFNVRPHRLEPYEPEPNIVKFVDQETGLPCKPFQTKKLETGNFLVTSEMTPAYRRWFLDQVDMETQYYNEDTEMMKQLCDIRASLWV